MGGYGSGRKWTRKFTVEDCRALEISVFINSSAVRSGGWISWKNHTGEVTSSIGYSSDCSGDYSATLRFTYTLTRDDQRSRIEEPVQLTTTRPFFGGIRWWFVCPLYINGRACQRRVRKLYLPSGGTYFGCRTCYNLTYESVQTHDNRIAWLSRDPARLLAALDSHDFNACFLGLRAALKLKGL